jgi:hypothetical protein
LATHVMRQLDQLRPVNGCRSARRSHCVHPLSPASTHIYGVISMAFMARSVTLLTHCTLRSNLCILAPLAHSRLLA